MYIQGQIKLWIKESRQVLLCVVYESQVFMFEVFKHYIGDLAQLWNSQFHQELSFVLPAF